MRRGVIRRRIRGAPSLILLLDTCALLWLVDGTIDQGLARTKIAEALHSGSVLISAASAWEIGLLSRRRMNFMPDPKTWFQRASGLPGMRLAPLTPDIAIDASHLPGAPHADPADRMIIATARHHGAAVVTRDRRILEYAAAGHVAAVAC